MNKYFASLLYLLLFILISCTFQPEDEDYFNKIEKTLPKTLINLNNYTSEDTIFIYTATSFQFDVSSNRGQFLEAKVLLGSRELFSGSNPKGSFTIDEQQFKTGIFKLRIQFLNSSGTGSLLDALGGEIVEAWQEWIVQIDFDLPPTPQITFSEENGFLKVSWTPYTKSNFKSYEVFAQGPGVYKRFTILNPQKNYWIDSVYLMGPSSYAITVNSNLGGTSIQKSINNSLQFTMLYRHQDSTAILRWRKLPYYRALGYYEVTENEGPPISITQASDTALDLKMKQVILGGSSWIDFKVKGKYNGYLHNERINVVNPLQLPQLSPAPNMFLNETQSLLGYVNGTLCNYNEFMVQENCRIISASHVPYKGPSTFYISKPYVVRHNLETGDEKKNLISSSTISVFGGVSGGANGIVTYSYIDETSVYDRRFHSVFLNMISGTIIHEENTFYDPKMGIYFNYLISDDGGYAYHQNGSRFYRINPNGLEVLFEFNYSLGVFLSFHPKNSGMAFFMEPITRAINIVNLNTETIDKTIQAPASGYTFKSYDPSTNYMVFTKDNARIIYFVNTETGQVTSLGALSDNYRLLNGVLFNSYGQYLKLFE